MAPTPLNPEARIQEEAERLAAAWEADERWQGIRRPYTPEQVIRLRGSLPVEHTLARIGAERLWRLLTTEGYVAALGVPGDRAAYLDDTGHMSGVDPLLALDRAVRAGKVADGDLVLLLAAGTGYTWAASTVRWGAASGGADQTTEEKRNG